tara:strand:+ start:105 stop:686 length:582 start_codon:yes stop_codon:yes gene_type:complete
MTLINFDLDEYIILFIKNFEDLYLILLVNKYFYQLSKEVYNQQISLFRKECYEKYGIFITKLFKNISLLRKIKYLEFKDSYIGLTDSLDNIPNEEITDSLMYGLDLNQYPFLIIKIYIENKNLDSINPILDEFETNLVIFQKSNLFFKWCLCSQEPYFGFFLNYLIDYKDIDLLQRLLNKETIQISNLIISLK